MPIDINEINKNSNGGTELMIKRLNTLGSEILDKYQIIPSRKRELDKTKLRVYWAHDLPHDPESSFLKNDGWNQVHRLAFVSYWQRQQYVDYFKIPWSKTAVLRNAIEPIKDIKKEDDGKIHLIYHTTPHRGLAILIPVFEKLVEQFPNLHLHVYSSFKIYGWDSRDEPYEPLFEKIMAHPNMTYYGTKTNEEVRDALKKAHIFAYPSIWPESSCLSLIEAMSAQCLCVHSDLAALPETSSNWTLMYPFDENPQKHASNFYATMIVAIRSMQESKEDIDIRLSSAKMYTDAFYNWDVRALEWKAFLKTFEHEPSDLPKSNESLFVYKT